MKVDIEQSLARGIVWLIAQQAGDGGWHSKTYGQLKDGAAVTTLILDSLSAAPQALQQQHLAAIRRAVAFLDRGLAKQDSVASPDGSLDFPTYASALWLTARSRFEIELPEAPTQRAQLIDYLVAAQVGSSRGFQPDSPSYGGWDFLGPRDAQGITTGTNLSVTRYALESLATASSGPDVEPVDAAIERGKAYALRCRQADGGFAFTCEPASLNNKAAYADSALTKPRSYGTATCDGIRALVACGVRADEEPVVKAIAWLAERPNLELVPGLEGFPPEAGWDRGLRFYYYAALSRVLPHFPLADRDSRREALAEHVVKLQKEGGHWINESDRMRENDPLIATALAVAALSSG